MADQVFAGAASDKAYVFRRSFQSKKWENVAMENKTSKVHFLKRSGNYHFRVIPDDGKTAVSGWGWVSLFSGLEALIYSAALR